MLSAIRGEQVSWQCLLYDKAGDLLSCGEERTAQLAETRYLMPDGTRGAVIALPRCTCGCQMFLKADYTLKEAWQACIPVVNDAGELWAFVMRAGHARNLLMHWQHYEQRNAPIAPVLPLPIPTLSCTHPDVLYALWFGYAAYQAYGQHRQDVPVLTGQAPLALEEYHDYANKRTARRADRRTYETHGQYGATYEDTRGRISRQS